MIHEKDKNFVIWKETDDEALERVEQERQREARGQAVREAFQKGYDEARK